MFKRSILLIFLSITFLFSKGEISMGTQPSDQGILKYQLDNGLSVILEENSSSSVVAINVWVKTGSACEQNGEYGLAHVHEHMLFKGTEKRAVGEIAKTIEAGGGDINAFTSFDETVYYVVSASRFLETALDILADAMQNSTFDPAELAKELEVVLEEIRRGEDSPSRVLSQKIFSTSYSMHSYKRPVIGTKESVKSFTRDKILNFYDKWYSPQNMVLVIVGDFNKNDIIPKIKDTFGKLKQKPIPACEIPKEPVQKQIRTFLIEKEINESYFSFAFHIPNAKHEDTPDLDVLSNILGMGDSSRLFRRVKEDKGLVNNIYSYAFTPKYDGLFVVGGTLDSEKINEAFNEIVKQVYKLKYEPVGNDELEKAKINIESDSVFAKETMQGQAQKLGFFEVEVGDYGYETEYLKKVQNVTPEDIMRIANKYLKDSNLTAGVLVPKGVNTVSDKELKGVILKSSKEIDKDLKKKVNKQREEVHRFVLKNGIKVLIKENHSVPLFAARAVFLGGVRFEDDDTNGISNFLSEMFTRGTKTRTAEDIAREIESIAGEIEGFSGRNSFGITVEAISKNFGQAMEIFSDVLLNPSFPEEEVERARREILSDINIQEDNLVKTAVNLFLKNLYHKHPYRFDVLGNTENVQGFKRNDLLEYYNSFVKPENLVIAVVGNVNSEVAIRDIEGNFGNLTKGDFEIKDVNGEKFPEKIREDIVYKKDKAQTHIILGFRGPTMDDDDFYAFEVLNSLLAGQGGRLFIELRDKKSLAYTVTSFLTPGIENGFFGIYIGTAPEKEKEAIEGIKEQIQILLKNGITDEELKRAQNYIVGNFEIGLQRNSAQVAKIAFDEIYGVGWDEYKEYPDKIFAITKEDVYKVAKKYIDLDKYTLAIVKNEASK